MGAEPMSCQFMLGVDLLQFITLMNAVSVAATLSGWEYCIILSSLVAGMPLFWPAQPASFPASWGGIKGS
jgi:hypothetical protein